MDLHEYRKAVESFNDAIRCEPEVGEHYYSVGFACIKLEEYQRAVDFLTLALKRPQPQPKMYAAMATALRGLGRDELAEEYDAKAGTSGGATGG